MKRFSRCIILLILILAPASSFASDGNAELASVFLKGVSAYEKGEFQEAAAAFQKVADTGVVNGKLYYNLGSAYFKTGDLGRAVLWYERAKRLMPNDPDLNFNYAHALSRVADEPPPGPGPFVQVILFWKPLLGRTGVKWAAVAMSSLFWLVLVLNAFIPKPALKTAAITLAAPLLILCATAFYDYFHDSSRQKGIVLQPEVAVRAGLTDDTTTLFLLHAGTQITIQSKRNGRVLVQYTRDKRGWVSANDIEAI